MSGIEESNINKRINYKDVTIGQRHFRIKKFDPLTGSYILFKIVGILTPVFAELMKNDTLKDKIKANKKEDQNKDKKDAEITSQDVVKIFGEITKLSKEDFQYIQKNCLMVVNEIHENGVPGPSAINEYNTIGISDADTALIMNLTIQSLIFNVSGFFGEKLSGLNLEGLTSSLQNLSM